MSLCHKSILAFSTLEPLFYTYNLFKYTLNLSVFTVVLTDYCSWLQTPKYPEVCDYYHQFYYLLRQPSY